MFGSELNIYSFIVITLSEVTYVNIFKIGNMTACKENFLEKMVLISST